MPTLLVVDPTGIEEDVRALGAMIQTKGRTYTYTMLLCDNPQAQNVASLVGSDVDDILQKPINNGELLARLRAGAAERAPSALRSTPATRPADAARQDRAGHPFTERRPQGPGLQLLSRYHRKIKLNRPIQVLLGHRDRSLLKLTVVDNMADEVAGLASTKGTAFGDVVRIDQVIHGVGHVVAANALGKHLEKQVEFLTRRICDFDFVRYSS